MRAVFRHELSGYFTTPVGYVFLTMYALMSGLVEFILSFATNIIIRCNP